MKITLSYKQVRNVRFLISHLQDVVRSAFGVIEKDVETLGQYYISATFNEMILDNKSIGTYEIPKKDYVTFSNYQMYENYLAHRRG